MLILVVLLVVTNLATLAVIGLLLLRRLDHPAPGPAVARTLDASAAPPEISSSATRQVISIEILNPIELAGTRGRLAGLAGSIVPGITKRVVHDQAMKMVRRVLVEEKVVADVRLHTIRPAPRSTERRPPSVAPTPRPVDPSPPVPSEDGTAASEPPPAVRTDQAQDRRPSERRSSDRRPSERRSSSSRSSEGRSSSSRSSEGRSSEGRSSEGRSSDSRSAGRRSSGSTSSSSRSRDSRDPEHDGERREHRSSSGRRRSRSSYDPSRSRDRDRSRRPREQDETELVEPAPDGTTPIDDASEPAAPSTLPEGSAPGDPDETGSGPRPRP